MQYRIDENYSFPNSDEVKNIKIAGSKHAASTDKDWTPEKEKRIGEIPASGKNRRKDDAEADYIVVDDKEINIRPYKKQNTFKRIFTKTAGWIHAKADNKTSEGFIRVVKTRWLAVIIFILILLGVLLGVLSLYTGTKPKDTVTYIADQAGITNNNADQKSTISYATYESTPDATWKAGTTKQQIVLSLPKDVSYTDKDGKSKTAVNPVVAAPSVWVDLNKDGKFTGDECVYNAPKYNKDGTVADPGKLLKAGNEIKSIQITKEIKSGSYAAQTLWTPQMADTGAQANPMTFNWTLTVQ